LTNGNEPVEPSRCLSGTVVLDVIYYTGTSSTQPSTGERKDETHARITQRACSKRSLGGIISHRVNLGRFFERSLSGKGRDIHDDIVEYTSRLPSFDWAHLGPRTPSTVPRAGEKRQGTGCSALRGSRDRQIAPG